MMPSDLRGGTVTAAAVNNTHIASIQLASITDELIAHTCVSNDGKTDDTYTKACRMSLVRSFTDRRSSLPRELQEPEVRARAFLP